MRRSFWLTLFAAVGLVACSQPSKTKSSPKVLADGENTLLWKITGKELKQPSWLFGTMHMICADDIVISDSLKYAIKNSDYVYLELDMDDMMQMMSAMTKMTMRDDTTLSDLLTKEEYEKVKEFFDEQGGMIPFMMLEKFKPMLIESLLMEQTTMCENMIIMEQLVMHEAQNHNKEIRGLESMEYQIGIFDSIPYTLQAKQLMKMIETFGKNDDNEEMKMLTDAYRNQRLDKMDELTQGDESIKRFADLLLFNRNINWVNKLEVLMPKNGLVIAVGAGHLPGDKGVISLLRKAGYTVEPVRNDMIQKKVKEI